jgi:hypothetical protein
MLQESALSTTTPPHNDEDIAAVNRKGEILLNEEIPVPHGEVLNDDMRGE